MVLIILLYQIVLDHIWRSKKLDLRDSKYSWTWEAFRALIWFEISFHVPGQIHFHFNMFSEKHDALKKIFTNFWSTNDRSSSFLGKFPNSKFFFAKNWIFISWIYFKKGIGHMVYKLSVIKTRLNSMNNIALIITLWWRQNYVIR